MKIEDIVVSSSGKSGDTDLKGINSTARLLRDFKVAIMVSQYVDNF